MFGRGRSVGHDEKVGDVEGRVGVCRRSRSGFGFEFDGEVGRVGDDGVDGGGDDVVAGG